jgi:hypothetical protein
MAAYLRLPLIKHNKLVEALVSASIAPPSNGGEAALAVTDNKFEAQSIVMGYPSVAVLGIEAALGISPEELPDLLKKGEQAIIDEFVEHGSADDKTNLAYILNGVACQEPLPNHIRTQISTGKYHGGLLGQGDFEAGHNGWIFDKFVKHEYCRKAKLTRPHVLSLRIYTSSSYACFNVPLQDEVKPHPFKMTVYYLNEAIKKLRVVASLEPDVTEEVMKRATAFSYFTGHPRNCPHLPCLHLADGIGGETGKGPACAVAVDSLSCLNPFSSRVNVGADR